MRRGDVASTSAQRHFYVMCQLGLVLCNLEVKQLFLLKKHIIWIRLIQKLVLFLGIERRIWTFAIIWKGKLRLKTK